LDQQICITGYDGLGVFEACPVGAGLIPHEVSTTPRKREAGSADRRPSFSFSSRPLGWWDRYRNSGTQQDLAGTAQEGPNGITRSGLDLIKRERLKKNKLTNIKSRIRGFQFDRSQDYTKLSRTRGQPLFSTWLSGGASSSDRWINIKIRIHWGIYACKKQQRNQRIVE